MRRRMRNVALTVVASASVLAALAGCGSSGSSSATTGVTLKLYNDKGAWSPFFNQLGTTSKKDIGIGMPARPVRTTRPTPGPRPGALTC